MPKADSISTTLSRRALMATSAGLVTADVAAAAIAVRAAQAMAPAATVEADAKLIRLCARWERLQRVYNHVSDKAAATDGAAAGAKSATVRAAYMMSFDRFEAVCNSIYDKQEALALEIAELPSRSWAGLAAKANAIKSDPGFMDNGHCLWPMVASLVEDVHRLIAGTVPTDRRQIAGVEV